MRRFLIDTDTASDDAVALIMALREPSAKVQAITVVAGNCPLATCVRNALVTVEKAGTYSPPVYSGLAKPIARELFTSEFVHGSDGMGELGLTAPELRAEEMHAIDAIIEWASCYRGELEMITLGPLTNLAVAVMREPRLTRWIKNVYIMGGAGLGPGNITPVAEFNFFVDAEAAHVVFESELQKTVIGWDVCTGRAFLDRSDILRLTSVGDLGRFAVRCNASLIEFNRQSGRDGFDLPDPTAVSVALYPEIVTERFDARCYVEYRSDASYGQFVIDRLHLLEQPENAEIVTEIDAALFRKKLFELLAPQAEGHLIALGGPQRKTDGG